MSSNSLHDTWTIWYDKPNLEVKTENWDQFLIEISSFNTLENFWSLVNNLNRLSDIGVNGSYHFFKKGIQPKWEDVENVDGGKWVFTMNLEHSIDINMLWEKTVSFLIGGGFGLKQNIMINGIVGSIKKGQVKFALWTKCSNNKRIQLSLGEKWKLFFLKQKLNKSFILEYHEHKN